MFGDIYNNKSVYEENFWKVCKIMKLYPKPPLNYYFHNCITTRDVPLSLVIFYQKLKNSIHNKLQGKNYQIIITEARTVRYPPCYKNHHSANVISCGWHKHKDWQRVKLLCDLLFLPHELQSEFYEYLQGKHLMISLGY